MVTSASTIPRWEHFEHEADIGIRGIGPSIASAFEQAALGLCATVTDPALVSPDELFEVDCDAKEDVFLFIDWLNALISEMSAQRMIFGRFEVAIAGNHLHGRAWGEHVDPARHSPAVEVKGATLTELRVSRDAGGIWTAQCVVDV